MKTLFTLIKGSQTVEVIQDGRMIAFVSSRNREWIIPKDLDSFTKFYMDNGYSKQL